MFEKLGRLNSNLENWAGAIMFPALMYIISRFLLTWAVYLHWGFSAILTALLFLVVVVLMIGITKAFFRKFTLCVVVSIFATIVLLSASVFASFSYILYLNGSASYTSPSELNPGRFADFYLWYFVDMIPGLDVWETLTIKPLVTAENFVAGIPLLLFRISVFLPILALIKKWLDFLNEENQLNH